MAHLRFNVRGMKGPACQARIEQELERLPGMWVAVICLDPAYMDVEYADDNGPSAEEMIAAVERAGYSARISG